MGDCMRKFKIFIILFLLVGCYSNSSDSNDKNVNIDHFNQNSRILYEFSHGINETDEIIEYSGNPIVLNYKLDNSGKKVSLGLFIAINGILQNYKINGELAKMHTISAEENEAKTVQIEFSPNIGKRGEEYNINFFTILEPKKIVKSLKDYINQHSINQLLTKKIIFLESVDGVESTFIENIKIEQMNEQDKEPYIIENNGDVNSKLDTETDVQILQDNNILNDEFISGKEIELRYCGPEGIYEVIEFNDMVPNALGSIEIKNDCFTMHKKVIDEGVKNYFIILIKKGGGFRCICKTIYQTCFEKLDLFCYYF